MQQKQRVFIYDRKEIGVLTLLGVMVAVFAFTLGVHLGKKVATQPKDPAQAHETTPVATVNDQVPEARELHEQSKGVEQAADETLTQSLKEEVGQVGAKTEKTVQVELPKKPKTENAGATTLQGLKRLSERHDTQKPQEHAETLPAVLEKEAHDAQEHNDPHVKAQSDEDDGGESPRPAGGRFSLQIGSYPALADAKARIEEVAKTGLKPFMREAQVEGRGRWYRVYVGEYPTRAAADKAGQKYRQGHLIDSFIVAKVTDVK